MIQDITTEQWIHDLIVGFKRNIELTRKANDYYFLFLFYNKFEFSCTPIHASLEYFDCGDNKEIRCLLEKRGEDIDGFYPCNHFYDARVLNKEIIIPCFHHPTIKHTCTSNSLLDFIKSKYVLQGNEYMFKPHYVGFILERAGNIKENEPDFYEVRLDEDYIIELVNEVNLAEYEVAKLLNERFGLPLKKPLKAFTYNDIIINMFKQQINKR